MNETNVIVAPKNGSTIAPVAQWRGARMVPFVIGGANGVAPTDLSRWLATGEAKRIKHGAHRTVYRLDLPEGMFYAKYDHPNGWLARLASWLRPTAASREARKARTMLGRGIATAEPVVWSASRRGYSRESILISRAIEHARSLGDCLVEGISELPRDRQASARRALVRAAARLLSEAHRQGIDHDDLHLGNILVDGNWLRALNERNRECTAGEPRLYLIDVPGVRIGRALGWRRARGNLAMLLAGARQVVSSADAWRFWREYYTARREQISPEMKRGAAAIVRQSWRHSRTILRSRDKRAWAENRDFYRVAGNEAWLHAVEDWPRDWAADLLAHAPQWFAAALERPVKLGHRGAIVEAKLPGGCHGNVLLKRFRVVAWKRWLVPGAWRKQAENTWRAGHALLARGIATPRPLAVVFSTVPRECYLVREWIAGAVNLHEYGWRLACLDMNTREAECNTLARQLSRLMAAMHFWRLDYRDAKLCNFLVSIDGPRRVWVCDVEDVRFRRWLGPRSRAKSLARLTAGIAAHPWLSRRTVAAFTREYARELGLSRAERRRLWQLVNLKAARHVERSRRRQVAPH